MCARLRPGALRRLERNRVISHATPRMTTRNPPDSKNSSPPCPVPLDCFETITGASWLIPAAATWPGNERHRGANHPAIESNSGQHQCFHAEFRTIERRPARRNHSSRSIAKGASAAPFFATTTIQWPGASVCWFIRKISRTRRRTRLRSTARPTRREVTMPIRKSLLSGMQRTVTRRKRP